MRNIQLFYVSFKERAVNLLCVVYSRENNKECKNAVSFLKSYYSYFFSFGSIFLIILPTFSSCLKIFVLTVLITVVIRYEECFAN